MPPKKPTKIHTFVVKFTCKPRLCIHYLFNYFSDLIFLFYPLVAIVIQFPVSASLYYVTYGLKSQLLR